MAFEIIFIFEIIGRFEVALDFEVIWRFKVVLKLGVVMEFRLFLGLESVVDPEVISSVVIPEVLVTNRRNRLMNDSLNIIFLFQNN